MGGITLPTPSTPGYTTFVDYRGLKWTSCVCLAQWLGLLQRVAIKRGHIRQGLDVWQLTGGAAASAGTHSQGGAFDLLYQTSSAFVNMCREFGADATWKRTVAQGFSKDHTHGVLVGCPHNSPARYQITAQRDGYNGLGTNGRAGPDNYPDPSPRRTWSQGVTEMKRELGLLAVATTTTLSIWPNPSIRLDDIEVRAITKPTNAAGSHKFEFSNDGGATWKVFKPDHILGFNAGTTAATHRFGNNHVVRATFMPKDATAFKGSSGTLAVTTVPVTDLATKSALDALAARVAALEERPNP